MKSMCTIQEKKKTAFLSTKYLSRGYIKVMLTATHSSNESNLQFLTGNLNRCLKQEQKDCHVGARAPTPIKPRDVQQVLSQSQNQQFDRNQRAVKVLHKPAQTLGASALPGGVVWLSKI